MQGYVTDINYTDNFFQELSNNPNNQGYIINYGTPAQIAVREKLITNHIAFSDSPRSNAIFASAPAPNTATTTQISIRATRVTLSPNRRHARHFLRAHRKRPPPKRQFRLRFTSVPIANSR